MFFLREICPLGIAPTISLATKLPQTHWPASVVPVDPFPCLLETSAWVRCIALSRPSMTSVTQRQARYAPASVPLAKG